jgi:hypothetical protein
VIELKIEKYCENCPFFEAEQDTFILTDSYHTIKCKNAEKCRNLLSYLQEVKK